MRRLALNVTRFLRQLNDFPHDRKDTIMREEEVTLGTSAVTAKQDEYTRLTMFV